MIIEATTYCDYWMVLYYIMYKYIYMWVNYNDLTVLPHDDG